MSFIESSGAAYLAAPWNPPADLWLDPTTGARLPKSAGWKSHYLAVSHVLRPDGKYHPVNGSKMTIADSYGDTRYNDGAGNLVSYGYRDGDRAGHLVLDLSGGGNGVWRSIGDRSREFSAKLSEAATFEEANAIQTAQFEHALETAHGHAARSPEAAAAMAPVIAQLEKGIQNNAAAAASLTKPALQVPTTGGALVKTAPSPDAARITDMPQSGSRIVAALIGAALLLLG